MNRVEQGEGFRTPNLEGKAFKEEGVWKTTTPLPTITNARVIDPPDFLRPGIHIQYDLLTITGENTNTYLATEVRRFKRKTEQKLKPKQRDKMKKRKI